MSNENEDNPSETSINQRRATVPQLTAKIAEPAIPILDVPPSTVKIVEPTIPVPDVLPPTAEEKKNYSK